MLQKWTSHVPLTIFIFPLAFLGILWSDRISHRNGPSRGRPKGARNAAIMCKHTVSVENERSLSFFQTVVYLLLGTLSLALFLQQALFFIGLSLSYMVFIASFFAVSAYLYHQKKANLDRLFFFVIFGIWASIIINLASWWARYVPQLWTFVPLTFAYFAGQSNRGNWLSKRHMDYISLFFLVVLTVNISVVGGMSSASAIWFSHVEKRDRQLFCSGHDFDWNWYAERMSDKYGSLFTATLKRKLHDFRITTEKGACY